MITMETIKKDLSAIRYYYVHKEQFDTAFTSIGRGSILDKVEKYNRAICEADPRIYEMYDFLFVRFRTYEEAAEILGYSPNYIYKACTRVYNYFYDYFRKEEAV